MSLSTTQEQIKCELSSNEWEFEDFIVIAAHS